MKYWQEYYLVKCTEKHFGEVNNIGDLGKITGYFIQKLQKFTPRHYLIWHDNV